MSRFLHTIFKPVQVLLHMSWKKKIALAVVLLVIFSVWYNLSSSTKKTGYTMAKPEKADITEYVTETGNITTSGKVILNSPTNGVIEEVDVINGQSVKTGDKLFILKSTATEQEKSQALANYLAAKASLDAATSTQLKLQAVMFDKWETFKKLAESDDYQNSDGSPKEYNRALPEFHIPQKEWLAAEKDFKQQETVIAQAKAAVSSTWQLYQSTQNATVKATADGVISNVSVTAGSTVNIETKKPLAVLSTSLSTEVDLSLSENDITKIKEGQDAVLNVKPIKDRKYKGIVKRVDTIGTEDKGVMRYNVYLEVTDADSNLRPGMNVDVTITTQDKKSILSLPNAAVKPYKGAKAVRVQNAKNGEVVYKPVIVGIKGKERTEIISGIGEKDEVIVALSNEQIKRPGLLGN